MKVGAVYGGVKVDHQVVLIVDASVIIAVPGRLRHFISDGYVSCKGGRYQGLCWV